MLDRRRRRRFGGRSRRSPSPARQRSRQPPTVPRLRPRTACGYARVSPFPCPWTELPRATHTHRPAARHPCGGAGRHPRRDRAATCNARGDSTVNELVEQRSHARNRIAAARGLASRAVIGDRPAGALALPVGIAGVTCIGAFLALTAFGVGGGGSSRAARRARAARRRARPARSRPTPKPTRKRNGAAEAGDGAPPAAAPTCCRSRQRVRRARSRSTGSTRRPAAGHAATARRLAARACERTGARPRAPRGKRAYADYLHLGAVYGALRRRSTARSTAAPAVCRAACTTRASPACTGWNRACGKRRACRAGCSASAPASSPTCASCRGACRRADHAAGIRDRAHEILEDALRDLLSGVDVPWSRDGVLATAAGVAATTR